MAVKQLKSGWSFSKLLALSKIIPLQFEIQIWPLEKGVLGLQGIVKIEQEMDGF